jgi:hypothetical protein
MIPPTKNVPVSPVEAQLLLQSVDDSIRSGKLDGTIRANGVLGLASLSALCERLTLASQPEEKPTAPTE